MTTEWKITKPESAGWYMVQAYGKAYWNGKKWLAKNKGKEIRKNMVTAWKPIPVKLTPWFSSDTKPSRIGEYLFRYNLICTYPEEYEFRAWWSGRRWYIRDSNYVDHWNEPVSKQGQWRGILK